MKYKEQIKDANIYKEEYLNSLLKLISDMHKDAEKQRIANFHEMKNNQAAYRKEFIKMLGWPLTDYQHNIPNAKKMLVTKEENMSVYRIQIDLPIGLKFYGIYFEHTDKGKLPLVIAQHGGDGSAELCSGFFEDGTENYNNMVLRIFNKGVNVFAPQLLIWKGDLHELPFQRERIDAKLKQVGSSITAVEVYALLKSIDYLSLQESIDSDRIGMIGLSYGGFYTLFTTAVDTRIKAALSSCFYNSREKYSWVDWTWKDAGFKFFDNEIAYLIYPRHLFLEVGEKDSLFLVETAKKEYEKLLKEIEDTSWIDFTVFDGEHEFNKDDKNIERLIEFLNNF